MRLEDLLLIDFEASGLGPGSWPIEVGLSWVEAERVQVWSSLIRPEPGWDPDAWDPVSEEIHGIPMSDLRDAPTARSVAEGLLTRVAGRPVFSDAPDFDLKWARRLLDAQPSPTGVRILDYDQAVGEVCGARGGTGPMSGWSGPGPRTGRDRTRRGCWRRFFTGSPETRT